MRAQLREAATTTSKCETAFYKRSRNEHYGQWAQLARLSSVRVGLAILFSILGTNSPDNNTGEQVVLLSFFFRVSRFMAHAFVALNSPSQREMEIIFGSD